jgi:DNA-binding beta-propeller fold protein YncE
VYLSGRAARSIEVVNAAGGSPVRTLPVGAESRDWRRLYRLSIGALDVIEPASGRVVSSHPAPDWARTVHIAGGGGWLVFGAPDSGRFQVQDAEFASPSIPVELDTRFSFDGLSADGRRLYLLEWLDSGRYQVRGYNLVNRELAPQVIADKSEVGQPMSGQAGASFTSRNGALQLTLYERSARGRAFVHALPVGQDLPFAYCIDLPGPDSGWGFVDGPDGRRFYAASPLAGSVVEIVEQGATNNPAVRQGGLGRRADRGNRAPAAAVSPDGSTLYVAMDHGLVAVDTRTLRPRATGLDGVEIDALGAAPDGSALYALAGPSRLLRIDPRTLAPIGSTLLHNPMEAILHVS